MRQLLFSLFVLLAVCTKTAAQTISVDDVEARAGNTAVSIALRVQGAEDMTSMHIEITDPSGLFAIQSASATPAWAAIFSTGSAGMSAISTSVNAFSGDGIVASIELSVPADIAIGTYPISITNARINGADIDGTTFNVTVTDYITLDENSTVAPEAAEAVNVRVLRTINANSWSTICLPFEMTEAQTKEAFGSDVQLADFTGYETEEDDDENIVGITVNFEPVTAIEANHPYIIKVSSPVTEFSVEGVDIAPEEEPTKAAVKRTKKQWSEMIGTYVAGTTIEEQMLFINGGKFWYSTGLTKMKAYRAYFDFYDVLTEVEEASVKVLFDIDDDETAIDEIINRKSSNSKCFDLSGRKVVEPQQHGVYIINGKKTLK